MWSRTSTASPTSQVVSSSTCALPIRKLKSSSSSRAKNVAPGVAENIATLLSTHPVLPSGACSALVNRLARTHTSATNQQPGLAPHSLLPHPSPRRKCTFICSGKNEADLSFSEAPSVNKAIPPHGGAWPTQGDLQCIGTTAAFRGQIPAITTRSSVIDAIPPQTSTAVSIRPEIANTSTKPKTPSPQKVSVKIEQASGKENVRVNVVPQSTC
jgi:hypothetical protein